MVASISQHEDGSPIITAKHMKGSKQDDLSDILPVRQHNLPDMPRDRGGARAREEDQRGGW